MFLFGPCSTLSQLTLHDAFFGQRQFVFLQYATFIFQRHSRFIGLPILFRNDSYFATFFSECPRLFLHSHAVFHSLHFHLQLLLRFLSSLPACVIPWSSFFVAAILIIRPYSWGPRWRSLEMSGGMCTLHSTYSWGPRSSLASVTQYFIEDSALLPG